MRAMTARSVLDEAKSEREAARALKASQDEQAQRWKDGKAAGLTGRDLTRYALEGKMGEGVRMNTVQGDDGYMYNVDPYNSTSQRVQVGGGQTQQHSQPSRPFDIKGDVPPEVAAAMQADPAAWENGVSIDIPKPPTYLRGKNTQAEPKFQSRQFTPQEVASMGLPSGTVAYSTEDGSPKIINKPNAIPGGQAEAQPRKRAMGADAANKVGLYDNAIRAAKQWHEIVAEKDASGNYTGGYNNTAAMSPQATSLYEQALRAKLRAESGAAISEPEIQGEMDRYGPKAFGSDATDLRNASALLKDLVQQRKLLVGSEEAPPLSIGQIIEKGGKKYRIVGGDPSDPDVEEVR